MTLRWTTIYQLCEAYLDSNYISPDSIIEIMGLKNSKKIQSEMEKIRDAYFDNVVDQTTAYSETEEDLDTYANKLYEYLIQCWEKQVKWKRAK